MKIYSFFIVALFFTSCIIITEEQECYKEEPPYDECIIDSIILYEDEATFKNGECYFEYIIVPCNVNTREKCVISSHSDDYCIGVRYDL